MLPESLIPDVLPVPRRRIAEDGDRDVSQTNPDLSENNIDPPPPSPSIQEPTPSTSPSIAEETIGIDDDSEDNEAMQMQQRLTLRELKEQCVERSIPSVGKKIDLVTT